MGKKKIRRKLWKDMESQVAHLFVSQYKSQGHRRLKSFTFKTEPAVNNVTKQKRIFHFFRHWKSH